TAIIPYKTLEALSNSEDVKHIQLAKSMQPNTNELIKNIKAIKVHQGEKPLNKPYKGKGVIVGIIDSGIDIEHEDFRDPKDPSKSRILAIWDHYGSQGKKPEGFSYGREYTKEEIEASINGSSKLNFYDGYGHGTHVSGIAAGNLGVAPEADIIVVKVDFDKSTSSIDAAKYIFNIADKLNRPCVINASYGFHNTLHNGSDPTEIMLNELINEKPGRVFIASAGNDGDSFIHLELEAKPNIEQWSWFIPFPNFDSETNKSLNELDLYGAVKNNDLDKISIAFGLDSTHFTQSEIIIQSKYIKGTDYVTLKEIADLNSKKTFTINYGDNSLGAKIEVTIAKKCEEYSEISIQVNETYRPEQSNEGIGWIRLFTKGSGNLHLWNLYGGTMFSPEKFELEVDDKYVLPDHFYTINTPGAAKDIITVGAYVNRTKWVCSSGKEIDYSNECKIGEFAPFSSHGPTIDGRVKPDISAPGMYVMSALTNSVFDNEIVSEDGKHVIESGTSMSAPAVTGAIALLFEKNPTLTNKEICDILFTNTDKDEYTGKLTTPDNKWGHGKLNIFRAITDNSVGINEIITSYKHQLIYTIYPNPCNEYIQLKLNSTNSCDIEIYNSMGSLVYKHKTNQQQKNIKVNTNSWNPGLYLIKSYNGNIIEQIKFMKN
ncbi:MAG: S8/S53 family peptidase, partial [Hyphomicrobiales bacterium]